MSENLSFFSAIKLIGPYINACELFVDQEGPRTDSLSCDVSIDTPDEGDYVHSESEHLLNHTMTIAIRLTEMVEGQERDLMHVRLSMNGAVTLPGTISATEEEIERNLLLNGISLFYSSARTYIEMLTGQSAMRRFTIPAIDPEAYVRLKNTEG